MIGARQVGKTYIIDKFCKENFEHYYHINFMKDKEFVQFFESSTNFEEKVRFLETTFNAKLDQKSTVLFVDEVQESESFIESLKFFCEDERSFHIICAGSLLGVKLRRFSHSFPLGKVILEKMYPMDFEEFLDVTNHGKYIELIRDSFMNDKSLPDIFHKKLLDLFSIFLYLGGMPEVISNYIENKQDILKMDDSIIKKIVNSYFNDMGKYVINKNETLRIQRIYKNIPSQLAKENQKFIFASLDKKDVASQLI